MTKRNKRDNVSMLKLAKINRELDRIKDLDLLLERLLFLARREARADAGTVYIRSGDELMFSHTQNDTFQAKLKSGEKLIYSYFRIPINDKSIAGFSAKNHVTLNIPDMYAIDPRAPYHFDPSFDERTGYKTVSTLTFPLISIEDDLLGVMQLINVRNDQGKFIPFRPEDEPFFENFARNCSKGIQEAQRTRSFLEMMVGLASLRDPKETAPHVNRVGRMSLEIYEAWAQKNNVDIDEMEKNKDNLRIAAMLHDIGKVAISDSLLQSPKLFDEIGRRIMKSHTWIGARILKDNSDLWASAREIALRHHENWDGTGYPGHIGDLWEADKYLEDGVPPPPGLKGRDIPFFARIVAVADVFDALISKRIYKEAWNQGDALRVLQEQSGTKFDPELIEIFSSESFLRIIHNIGEKYPDFGDT